MLATNPLCKTDTIGYDLTDQIYSDLVIHICSYLVNCIF